MTKEKRIEPRVVHLLITTPAAGKVHLCGASFSENSTLAEDEITCPECHYLRFLGIHYGDCPEYRKEQLKQAEKDGFVVQYYCEDSDSWKDRFREGDSYYEGRPFVLMNLYRITDRKREERNTNGHLANCPECYGTGCITGALYDPPEQCECNQVEPPEETEEPCDKVTPQPQPDAEESDEEFNSRLVELQMDLSISRRLGVEKDKQIAELTKELEHERKQTKQRESVRDLLRKHIGRIKKACGIQNPPATVILMPELIQRIISKVEYLKAGEDSLEQHRKALKHHELEMMIESNGRCSLHDVSKLYETLQRNITRSITEAIEIEQERDTLKAENEKLKALLPDEFDPDTMEFVKYCCRIKRSEVTRLKEGE